MNEELNEQDGKKLLTPSLYKQLEDAHKKMLDTQLYIEDAQKHIEDAFDVNYAVNRIKIDTLDEFDEHLLAPFKNGDNIFYRGERIATPKRRLVPTYFRSDKVSEELVKNPFTLITGQTLFDFYQNKESFSAVYQTLYGKPDVENMYRMLAFAQHYLDVSPFIDFTASLYVALSFALKGRRIFTHDIVIYTAFDIGDDDTTSDENEVNKWLYDYSVGILRAKSIGSVKQILDEWHNFKGFDSLGFFSDKSKFESLFSGASPTAKLIDIPTNDLMKYQQGVFLLLNNFCMLDTAYFTKTVRQSFVIKKYIIDKNICPLLQKMLEQDAPQYKYECLLDISQAVREK